MTFSTRELSPDTWPDFERLFVPGSGWAFCACMFFQRGRHLDATEFRGREAMRVQNMAEKRALVHEGRAHGILVYEVSEPVGWCQYGPVEELPLRGSRRTSRRIPPVESDVRWRITCFVTAIRRRRRGIAGTALRAALASIRERGGGLVEAYPPVTPLRPNWDHGGTVSIFEREGFAVVARPDAPYVVMRRVV
ncbi:MAG: GNAT family N-acetyltransferase [Gemmatimonadales bacterium]